MTQKKTTLGRGLADLLGQARPRPPMPVPVAPAAPLPGANPPPGASPTSPAGEELANLPLDRLERGRYQPRVDMRQETLEELAISIRNQGVIQPIVVGGRGAPPAPTRAAAPAQELAPA